MAAKKQVIYGDCRSVSNTLSSFLSGNTSDNSSKEYDIYECGYDPSLFINEKEVNKYLCAICQHVVKNAIDCGCGNKHIFCENCFNIYYDLNYNDYDNNFILYGIGNEDWNISNDHNTWNPNKIKKQLIKCPLCQCIVKQSYTIKLPLIDKIINNNLLVKCPLEICKWKGKLIDLE
eukprot:484_1